MKGLRYLFISLCLIIAFSANAQDRKLFITGGAFNTTYINYLAELTGKERPRICYIPTASGDNERGINRFYEYCASLNVEPVVMRVWIASYRQKESWEEILSNVDAVMVGGGNTLNMLAIWKAQGIDVALRNAYEKGVVMSGGSAGSLCWFTGGTTDSRPKELSIVHGLGYIQKSHCPHYNSEESRRPLYHNNILNGVLQEGYAVDDRAGLLFINEQLTRGVSLDADNHAWFVSVKDGNIVEDLIETEIID